MSITNKLNNCSFLRSCPLTCSTSVLILITLTMAALSCCLFIYGMLFTFLCLATIGGEVYFRFYTSITTVRFFYTSPKPIPGAISIQSHSLLLWYTLSINNYCPPVSNLNERRASSTSCLFVTASIASLGCSHCNTASSSI